MRDLRYALIRATKGLRFIVKDLAPSDEIDLFNSPSLVIWSGESDNSIWDDPSLNHLFRALHDNMHLQTKLNFSIDQEIELGRIQANKYQGLFSDLIYLEIAGQATYYRENGVFIKNQKQWTLNQLKGL